MTSIEDLKLRNVCVSKVDTLSKKFETKIPPESVKTSSMSTKSKEPCEIPDEKSEENPGLNPGPCTPQMWNGPGAGPGTEQKYKIN